MLLGWPLATTAATAVVAISRFVCAAQAVVTCRNSVRGTSYAASMHVFTFDPQRPFWGASTATHTGSNSSISRKTRAVFAEFSRLLAYVTKCVSICHTCHDTLSSRHVLATLLASCLVFNVHHQSCHGRQRAALCTTPWGSAPLARGGVRSRR